MAYTADEQLVLDLFKAMVDRDVSAALPLTHPEYELHLSADLPYGGVYRGHDGLARALRGSSERWARYETICEEVRTVGEYILISGRHEVVVNEGDDDLVIPFASFNKVRDGLVFKTRQYTDSASLTRLLEEHGKIT